jgi:hypothetical protein
MEKGHRVGEAMVAARRIITLTIDPDQHRALVDISTSLSQTAASGSCRRRPRGDLAQNAAADP